MRILVYLITALSLASPALSQPPAAGGGRQGGQPVCGQGALPPGGGGLAGKNPCLPSNIFVAPGTVGRTTLRHQWVDIPVGGVNVRTWIQYPEGDGPAPVVLVMHHAQGLDDWTRAAADQLAFEGFIAVAPDLYSGFGPAGGGTDSFRFPDETMRATAGKLTAAETLRRYRAAWNYALKLPRSNGRGGTIGFREGGDWSFRFAGEVPDVGAAVVFYGRPPNEATIARIKAPVLGLYASEDTAVTATVPATTAAMKKLGKVYESRIYEGATHAFLMYQVEAVNNPATTDSWPRATAFLRQYLK